MSKDKRIVLCSYDCCDDELDEAHFHINNAERMINEHDRKRNPTLFELRMINDILERILVIRC